MTNKEFTIDDAITVQARQLLQWKKVLQPEVFYAMLAWCDQCNASATKTDHIKRGTNLDNWLHNYMNNL